MGAFFKVFDEKVLVFVVGIGIVVLNHYTKLFDGVQTTDRFLVLVLPYLVVMVFALVGFNIMRYSKTRYSDLIPVLFLAPLTFTVFALLKGLFTGNIAGKRRAPRRRRRSAGAEVDIPADVPDANDPRFAGDGEVR